MSQIEADSMLLLLRGLVVLCCACCAVSLSLSLPRLRSSVLSSVLPCQFSESHHITTFLFPRSIFAFLQIFTALLSITQWEMGAHSLGHEFEI